jgi:branched-chain amino acid transport system ATP-binding protein
MTRVRANKRDLGLPAQSTAVSVRGVTVRFGGVTALSDVSIDCPKGSIVGIIGPNGAGKSTLFGVFDGTVRPNAGTVHLGARDVSGASPEKRARYGLARTFQRPEPFRTLTVRQHLQLAYRARHARGRLISDLVPGWRHSDHEEELVTTGLLELLGLEEVSRSPVGMLPLGTVRRVEVARALATLPEILLLDEPASGMDTAETRQLMSALLNVKRNRDLSIVLVEHDLDMVLNLCEVVHVLDFGQLITSGPPEKIRSDPAVVAAYIGGGTQ